MSKRTHIEENGKESFEKTSLSVYIDSRGNTLTHANSNPSLENSIIEATKSKDIDQLVCLLANRDDQKIYGTLVAETAAEHGHIVVFELLRSYGIIDVGNALHNAARNGHIHVLEYLQRHTLATCSAHVMDDAATQGNLEVVQWICRNRPEGCTAAALIGAAANGHVDVMNFLILNVASLGHHMQVACDAACKMGQMNVIKYAVNMWMCGCSPTGLDDLAMFGDTGIIEYLLDNDVLPPRAYLQLASDLSDEDTHSLGSDDEKLSYLNFDNSDGDSDSTDHLNADLYEEDADDMFLGSGSGSNSDYDDGVSDYDDIVDDEGDGNGDGNGSGSGGAKDEDEDEDDEYDIDDEEDSFDRYFQKKRDTILTCLFDDSGHMNPSKNSSVIHADDIELGTVPPPPRLSKHVSTEVTVADTYEGEVKSTGANSISINDLDFFRLRSLAGDTRNFETYRKWSPVTWREHIENTMDSVVCNPDRMTMLPFLAEKFCGRISCVGVDRACEAGYLDVLQWIFSKQCTSSVARSFDSSSRGIFTPGAMAAACAGGQGAVARWLLETVRFPPPTPEVAKTAAVKGSVSFLEWLYVTCGIEIHPETCNLATSSGNCSALIWLHGFCNGECVITTNAADLAAINGHMDVIIFLESIGIKSSAVAADGALMNGHMAMYNHLTELGAFPSRYAVRYAALPWPSFGPRLALPSSRPGHAADCNSTDGVPGIEEEYKQRCTNSVVDSRSEAMM